MRGFPESFATKQDYLNGIATYPEKTKAELRRLIAGRFEFVQTGVLAEGEEGVEDESHKVLITQETDSEGRTFEKRVQFELREDANARLFRLGFTLEEAERLVS